MDQQIDENLKRVYEDTLNEAVPEKFLDLIEQLKTADGNRKREVKDRDDA